MAKKTKKKVSRKPKLSPMQKKFVREYTREGNATKAAVKAGYSEESAKSHVYEMLRKPQIQAEIEKTEKKIQEKFDLKEEEIIKALMQIAFFDPMEVLEWDDDRLVFKKNVAESYMRGANFTIYPEYQSKADKRDGILRAKLSISSGDRRGALELLGRRTGMWRDKDGGSGTDKESRASTLRRVRELFSKHNGQRRGDGGSES